MASELMETLDETRCRALLAQRSLGRVAVKLGEDLAILPVYYAVFEGDIVFATQPGTKLSAAVMNSRFTFEVDNEVPPWSVLVVGYGREVRNAHEYAAARAELGAHWPTIEHTHIVRIRSDRITGRRVRE